MGGTTASSRISAVITIPCACLFMTLLAFGCKEKTEQAGGPEQTREVAREEPQKEISAEEHENQLVFDMEEVSIFDLSDDVSRAFLWGQTIVCDQQPGRGRPGQYPPFKSTKPIHGMIRFAGKTVSVGQSPPPMYYPLAIDESAGTATGYDRLYFDHNGDGDLADERPLMALKDPPNAAMRPYSSTELQVYFESFEIIFDFGPAGRHAVELIARLMTHQHSPELTFFPTKVRRGEIKIGDAKYDAVLGYAFFIGSPFDQPGTLFHLIPKNSPQDRARWSGANRLNVMHDIGGQYYRFATTPLGDTLFVRPYEGALGTLEVGRGGRDIEELSIQGSLRSEDTAVAVGDGLEHGWPRLTRSCLLPEGDYLPEILTLTLGQVRVTISDNYHADGKPRGRDLSNRAYRIKIRRDKPHVFDLANKPDVLFASPARDKRVKLGEDLAVKAVLIDPELDIMIRGLYDMASAQTVTVKMEDGQERTGKRVQSLDPKVVITRANGEQVAEGVMPFG